MHAAPYQRCLSCGQEHIPRVKRFSNGVAVSLCGVCGDAIGATTVAEQIDHSISERARQMCAAKGLPFHHVTYEHGDVTVYLDAGGSSISGPLPHIWDMLAAIKVERVP